MALNREYFNAIELTSVRNKFYEQTEVDTLLVDIRRQALEMAEELEKLRAKANETESGKTEVGEILLSARYMASQIVAQAKIEAEEIRNAAVPNPEPSKNCLEEKEEMIQRVSELFETVKKHHERGIEETNRLWQSFLAEMMDDEPVPGDLKSKIAGIAKGMSEISGK